MAHVRLMFDEKVSNPAKKKILHCRFNNTTQTSIPSPELLICFKCFEVKIKTIELFHNQVFKFIQPFQAQLLTAKITQASIN